jgi:Amidohydrolase
MKAIDVHAHVFPTWLGYIVRGYFTFRYLERTDYFGQIQELWDEMGKNNIETCFVQPLPNRPFYRKANEYISGIEDERLVKFGTVFDPEEIKELKDNGFFGVKLHFPLQQIGTLDYSKILDKAEKHELVVMVHISEMLEFDKYETKRLDALRGRTNTIIVPHLSAIKELQDEKNVWFDTAMRKREEIERAARKSKKLLFGSDFPIHGITGELEKIKGLKEEKNIRYSNAKRLIKQNK